MAQKTIHSRSLAHIMRDARKRAGYTQEQAAQHIDVARTTLVALEQGVRQFHTREFAALAGFYGCDPTILLEMAEHMGKDEILLGMLAELSPEQRSVLSRLLHTEPAIATMQAVKIMACGMSAAGLEDVACAMLQLLIDQECEEGTNGQ